MPQVAMVKTRTFPEHNYKALFVNGKTMRLRHDQSMPITCSNKYPEFMDVAINDLCYGACPYCYVEATHKGKNYSNVLGKIDHYFGSMTENQRPFQVAIGGAGEPTLHPEFPQILERFAYYGILPNYTTNGMHLNQEILDATVKYSGGVALTCHPHLDKHWQRAIPVLQDITRLNLHIIIGDKQSVMRFCHIYERWQSVIDYFVLLPYQPVGFAKPIDTAFDYLFNELKALGNFRNIAFGAFFHEHLKDRPWLGMSLYEPEMFSKYLDMDKMTLYPSSFDLTPINHD
jgi:hypothetical protein